MSWQDHIWLLIAIIGLAGVNLVTRSFFLLTPAEFQFSPLIQRALCYAPVVAIVAIIAPSIFMNEQSVDLTWHNKTLIATIIAGIAFVWYKNLLLTIVIGLVVFTLLRLFVHI